MSAPELISLEEHRDRPHWWQSAWVRRALLGLPIALVVAGLLNVFGQRAVTTSAQGKQGKLTVYAPVRGRSGVVYAARFRVDAIDELKQARLVFDPGWADGYTVNGLAPQPLTERSSDGRLTFGFGHIPRGHHLIFWLSLQINPTHVGRHSQDVWLYDGKHLIARADRTITIFP